MSERRFRLILGIWLIAALLFKLPQAIVALLAVLSFEGITNWRIPLLVSRLRAKGHDPDAASVAGAGCELCAPLPFEAERALRLIVVVLLVTACYLAPQLLWWLPWFIGFALVGAGLSGICPMVLALRWIGLR